MKVQEGLEEAARSKLHVVIFLENGITDCRKYREEEGEGNSLMLGMTEGLLLMLVTPL